MSARIQWTIQSSYANGSHPPIVSMNGSCDSSPLHFTVQPGQEVTLAASGSYDPDSDLTSVSSPMYTNPTATNKSSSISPRTTLHFTWFQYKEPSNEPHQTFARPFPDLNITLSANNRTAIMAMASADEVCYELTPVEARMKGVDVACMAMHVLVEVRGSGEPPIRRWKRAILEVQPPEWVFWVMGSGRGGRGMSCELES